MVLPEWFPIAWVLGGFAVGAIGGVALWFKSLLEIRKLTLEITKLNLENHRFQAEVGRPLLEMTRLQLEISDLRHRQLDRLLHLPTADELKEFSRSQARVPPEHRLKPSRWYAGHPSMSLLELRHQLDELVQGETDRGQDLRRQAYRHRTESLPRYIEFLLSTMADTLQRDRELDWQVTQYIDRIGEVIDTLIEPTIPYPPVLEEPTKASE